MSSTPMVGLKLTKMATGEGEDNSPVVTNQLKPMIEAMPELCDLLSRFCYETEIVKIETAPPLSLAITVKDPEFERVMTFAYKGDIMSLIEIAVWFAGTTNRCTEEVQMVVANYQSLITS